MLSLIYIYVEYESRTSSWDICNGDPNLMIDLLLFQLATRLTSHYTYETVFHNEFTTHRK